MYTDGEPVAHGLIVVSMYGSPRDPLSPSLASVSGSPYTGGPGQQQQQLRANTAAYESAMQRPPSTYTAPQAWFPRWPQFSHWRRLAGLGSAYAAALVPRLRYVSYQSCVCLGLTAAVSVPRR